MCYSHYRCISRAIIYGHFVIYYAANTSPFGGLESICKRRVYLTKKTYLDRMQFVYSGSVILWISPKRDF